MCLTFFLYLSRPICRFLQTRHKLAINTSMSSADDLMQFAVLHDTPIIEFLEICPVSEDQILIIAPNDAIETIAKALVESEIS